MQSSRSARIAKEDIAPDWTNRWSHLFDLNGWQGLPGDRAWFLEHKWDILGQPELLLYEDKDDQIIFRAGGMYYIWGDGHHDLFVFRNNTTLPDILKALREERVGDLVSSEPLDHNHFAELMSDAYKLCLLLEVEQGRDRRREQSDRGGYPSLPLFKKTNRSTWTLNQSTGDNETATSDMYATDESSVEGESEGEDQSQDEDFGAEDALYLSEGGGESLGVDSTTGEDGGESQNGEEAKKSKDDEHTSESHDNGPAGKHQGGTGNIDQSQDEDGSGTEETSDPGKGEDGSVDADSTNNGDSGRSHDG